MLIKFYFKVKYMAHALENYQKTAMAKEKELKALYSDNKFLAKQLIAGAKQCADCVQTERSEKWWVSYIQELEKRLS